MSCTPGELEDSETFMEIDAIRLRSIQIAMKAGLTIPASLPLLEEGLRLRNIDEVVARMLCLTAIAAASYGFDKKKTIDWLRQERLTDYLTEDESHFLVRGEGNPRGFQIQVEGLWALAWGTHLVASLDFWQDCDSRFVAVLPNLKTADSSETIRRQVQLRPVADITEACDLAYCLHWAVRQSELDKVKPPAGLKPYLVEERRRALDWFLTDESWDKISLDT